MKEIWEKIYIKIITIIISTKAEIGIKSAIRVMQGIYSDSRKCRNNEKENRQYLTVIKIPVVKRKKRKRFLKPKEKLYWVNRHNFREVKRRGWLSGNMRLDELRAKAFYYTNAERTYQQEQIAVQKAINKYKTYMLSKI